MFSPLSETLLPLPLISGISRPSRHSWRALKEQKKSELHTKLETLETKPLELTN